MKKVLLCLMAFIILSCTATDDTGSEINTSAISFTLNGVDYSLSDYNELLNPTNTNERIIEVSFDDDTKSLLFSVIVEETNQIEDLVFTENGTHYISDQILGDRETSITTHTDVKMEGTFRVTFEDTRGEPKFIFTNGVIDIEY